MSAPNAVCQFLKNNSLLSIIRAHEAQTHCAAQGFPPESDDILK